MIRPERALDSWAKIAEIFAQHRAPAYGKLAQACAVDPFFENLGPPLIVLHAVRLAALKGRARDPWAGDVDAFREDVQKLDGEIAAAVRRGLVQFTEPMRMADLLPGYLIAADRYPGLPLRLIDLGACAGLHLVPECYEIHYAGASWLPSTASMKMESPLKVPIRLLEREISILDRVGIDLAPVNPQAPESFTYLRSFSWAGDPAREQRLEEALRSVAPWNVDLRAGSILDLFPPLLQEKIHRDVITVVIDSAMSSYLSGRESLKLGRHLDQMAWKGPLLLLSRGRAVPNDADLPRSVKIVDLSNHWCLTYAASDLLSERMQWLGPRWDG